MEGGQFRWGICLLKGNGGVHKVGLAQDGNLGKSARVYAGLTARETSRAGGKPGPSEPTLLYRKGGDHRLKVTPGITG